MKNWCLAFFVTLILSSSFTFGQDCTQLLQQGIYDISSSKSDTETSQTLMNWFCESKLQDEKSSNDFGGNLAFPFKGIPIQLGFNSNNDNWSSWYTNVCNKNLSDSSFSQKLTSYVRTINPNVLIAFKSCIETPGLHVWIERTNEPKTFYVQARFVTPTKTISTVTIKKLSPSHKNVSCTPDSDITVGAAVVPVMCTRSDNEPAVLSVDSDWTISGGSDIVSLPAISQVEAIKYVEACKFTSISEQQFTIAESSAGFVVACKGMDPGKRVKVRVQGKQLAPENQGLNPRHPIDDGNMTFTVSTLGQSKTHNFSYSKQRPPIALDDTISGKVDSEGRVDFSIFVNDMNAWPDQHGPLILGTDFTVDITTL